MHAVVNHVLKWLQKAFGRPRALKAAGRKEEAVRVSAAAVNHTVCTLECVPQASPDLEQYTKCIIAGGFGGHALPEDVPEPSRKALFGFQGPSVGPRYQRGSVLFFK